MTTTPPTPPPKTTSSFRKWALPCLLVAAGAVGISQYGSTPPIPTDSVVVMQDDVAGTEAYQSGHVYKVIQTYNMNGKECAISPSDPAEVKFWATDLLNQLHQHIPSTRQNFMALPAAGTDIASPLPWKMYKGPATIPSGAIDTGVCTAAYDGGNGISYVRVDKQTDGTYKETVVAPPGWHSATTTTSAPPAAAAPAPPAAAAPASPDAAASGTTTSNAVVTAPKS